MRVIDYDSTNFEIKNYVIAKIIKINQIKDYFEYIITFHKDYKLKRGIIVYKSSLNKGNIIKTSKDPLLHIGDILEITNDKKIILQLSYNSNDNSLLVNNHCNLKCINCPQVNNIPLKGLEIKNKKIIDFLDNKYNQIGLTGGEPTLNIDYLARLISQIYKKNNAINIDILTNAINLAKYNNFQKLNKILKQNVTFCIALYADIPEIHDYLTGIKGSFFETINAMHTIASYKRNIELRFVINKINFNRLPQFIQFAYDHFPYIDRIALMAMEYSGQAKINAQKLFIKQSDYAQYLFDAIKSAKQRNQNIFIYNHQTCKLPSKIWEYCVPTISDWKNIYLPKCNECDFKTECGGFFDTSDKNYIEYDVNPIKILIKNKLETKNETMEK
ncbi:MAG: His-Xaa-Ser system radical SAM maturase HxsC [Pleomorphochaeta sp.]